MNYGLYISASAVSVQMAKQDVLANNLSNINTTGFRPDFLTVEARDAARVEDALVSEDSERLLERLGAGVVPGKIRRGVTPGPVTSTGRGLDAAIDGDGFFVVQVDRGAEGMRVTRDGRFSVSAQGDLVTADGAQVMGANGGPIQVDGSRGVEFLDDGSVVQEGEIVGQLRMASVENPDRLVKVGKGLLRMPEGEAMKLGSTGAQVVPRALEGSAVDTIKTMMDSTSASRAAQSSLRMISLIGENMQMAINRFGRVS